MKFLIVTILCCASGVLAGEPEDLAKNRKIYLEKLQEIEQERDAKVRQLTKRYIEILEKTQEDLTKDGKLDAALAVRDEIHRLNPLLKSGGKEKEFGASKQTATEESEKQELKKHPKDAEKFLNHYYKYFSEELSWDEAQKKCQEMGGYLVTISTERELEFVSKVSNNQFIWVGATDVLEEGKWLWVDGKAFDTTLFGSILRTDNKNNQDWLSLRVSKGQRFFDDHWITGKPGVQGYVCEWED